MDKAQADRYVKIIRRTDNNGGHYFRVSIYSENPKHVIELRRFKQFCMDYETATRSSAETYAHKLAEHLECRFVE